jgi:hypothetical protein
VSSEPTGVVIRCPNCGTTQSSLGECDACHEAETRYFCPNHEPGRWLDGPSCSACGARVGVPGASSRPAPPRAPARAPVRDPVPPSARAPTRSRVEPPRGRERDDDEEVFTGPVFTPGRMTLEDVLRSAMRGGRRGGMPGASGGLPDFPPMLPTGVKIVSAFGCLRRLVMLVIFLAILAAVAFFSLFGVGGLLYGDSGRRSGAVEYAVGAPERGSPP